MKPEIRYYSNLQKLSQAAADFFCKLAEECVNTRGVFTVALSGGSTPKMLYELLAQNPYLTTMPCKHIHVFWGDERYVPADHADSNFAMASQALVDHVPIPSQNVHRIPTDHESPEKTAEAYEKTLRHLFHSFDSLSEEKDLPVFDLILLGMGKDGHTASLFPDSPVLNEQERWVTATPVPNLNPPVRRITLTFPVINAARNVAFLIAGKEKQPIVQTILDTPEKARELYPTARLEPTGKLLWFLVEG